MAVFATNAVFTTAAREICYMCKSDFSSSELWTSLVAFRDNTVSHLFHFLFFPFLFLTSLLLQFFLLSGFKILFYFWVCLFAVLAVFHNEVGRKSLFIYFLVCVVQTRRLAAVAMTPLLFRSTSWRTPLNELRAGGVGCHYQNSPRRRFITIIVVVIIIIIIIIII